MTFPDYYRGLLPEQREHFARRAGLSLSYIYVHLACSPPRKVPSLKNIHSLADATEGAVSREEMLQHFETALRA